MVYRYTLPAQPSPYTCKQRELSLRSRTISNAIASSPGLKRANFYSHSSLDSKVRLRQQQPWTEHIDKENVKITTYPVSSTKRPESDYCEYNPADPTTWGVKPLPPLPLVGTPVWNDTSIFSHGDDDAAMLQSPILPPCPDPMEPTHSLAQLVGDHLRIDDEAGVRSTDHRTTSSSYHDPDYEPSGVHSPVSNAHVRMLSVTELAKYGKANDRLSNLRSGSPSSATGELHLHDGLEPHDDSSSAVNS